MESLSTVSWVLLLAVVSVLNAQGNSQSSSRARLVGAKSQLSQLSEAPMGPIGVNRHVLYHCTFHTNQTYTCKTDCDANEDTQASSQSFQDQPAMRYTDFNCSTPVPTGDANWKLQDGLINKDFDRSAPSVIIATCAFYQTNWYECYGVADCGHGEGITQCAGAAPWRGYYKGTPQKGFRGNITAEAMNSQPMLPPPRMQGPPPILSPLPSENLQVSKASTRELLYACEKFVNTDAICNRFQKECGATIIGRDSCTRTRVPFFKTSATDSVFKKFYDVVNLVNQGSPDTAAFDIVVACYFYTNNEYVCGLPFGARITGPSNLTPTTGSYYSGSS